MLRNVLIKKYIDTKDTQRIIGHSSVVYIKKAIITIVLLFLLYVIFALLNQSSPAEYRKWIFWGAGLALFIKWVIDFLNLYLDCLILSKDNITFFLWEGLLEYKTEIFSRNKINTISRNQIGFRDKLFWKWDILIKLEFDTEFPFNDVSHPKKQVRKLMMLKEEFLSRQKQQVEKDLSEDNDRFNVLVEAMSEVVKEYLDQKTSSHLN